MRNLLLGLVVVGLLAATSQAVVDVKVLSSKTPLNAGETAVITVQVKAPAGVGVASLAGSVNASTAGLNASGFAFASAFNRPSGDFVSVGGAAANGGWVNFGSGQNTQLMNNTSATYGAGTFVTFATYTVTAASLPAAADVTLTFVPAPVGGFLLVSTDKDETAGTNATVTIHVNADNVTPQCWGDIDKSGFVDGDDLAVLAYAWMQGPADANWYPDADLDGSGFVDGDDLAVLAYGWLDCIPM